MKNNIGLVIKTSVLCAFVLALSAGTPGNADAWFGGGRHGSHYGQRDGGYRHGGGWDCPKNGVPEIDPSTATLAIGVAGGALAILRDRRRRR